jgi:hypothetical protein
MSKINLTKKILNDIFLFFYFFTILTLQTLNSLYISVRSFYGKKDF